jgi:hypothetical protein
MKYLFTIPLTLSLAVFLSACNQPSNSVPIQSDSGYSDEYQNAPPLTNTEALAVGVATGYAVGKYANKPKPKVRVSRYKRK